MALRRRERSPPLLYLTHHYDSADWRPASGIRPTNRVLDGRTRNAIAT